MDHVHHQCGCISHGRRLQEYLHGEELAGFKKISCEDLEFTTCMQMILACENVVDEILKHQCREDCVVCELRKIFKELWKADCCENVTGYYYKILEKLGWGLKSSTEFFCEIIKRVFGSEALHHKLSGTLKLENTCTCGVFRGKTIFKHCVFLGFSLASCIEPLPHYYKEFIHYHSGIVKINTSRVLSKQQALWKVFINHHADSLNFSNQKCLENCRKSLIFKTKSNLPNVLIFPLCKKEEVLTRYSVFQLAVLIQGQIDIPTTSENSETSYGLVGIIVNSSQNSYIITCSQAKKWCRLEGTSNNKIGKGLWYDVVLNLIFNNHSPNSLVYSKGSSADTSLSLSELFLLENINYEVALSENPQEKLNRCYILTSPEKFQLEEEKITVCLYCKIEKVEGIECEFCKYNEGPWTCLNNHKNFATSFTCDYCLENRCQMENKVFDCTACRKTSIGQNQCQYCPVSICIKCGIEILPGRTSFCVGCNSFSTAVENKHPNMMCKACGQEITDFI